VLLVRWTNGWVTLGAVSVRIGVLW
jgi:hypothetical protein